MATSNATDLPTLDELKARDWWDKTAVAAYLTHMRGKPCTPNAAKLFMHRSGVRRSKTDRRLTCKNWVDAALNRK